MQKHEGILTGMLKWSDKNVINAFMHVVHNTGLAVLVASL